MITPPGDAFQKNVDGSWTSVASTVMSGPGTDLRISPGITFWQGAMTMGIDVAEWLDANSVPRR